MKLDATNQSHQMQAIVNSSELENFYDNFELAQIRGEEQFHLEENEFFLREMARKTAKKQVQESLSARKGKIPSLLELLELEDEVPF